MQVKLIISVIVGSMLLVMNVGSMNESLLAEQRITVLPDAHSDTAVRFVDITSYFLPVGEELTLFNDDFVGHNLVLTTEDNNTQIQQIELPSNSSFNLEFEEPGKYYYFSEEYPRVQGSIRVLDSTDISLEKITGLKNNVDVQIAWTPSRVLLSNPSVSGLDPKVDDDGDEAQEGKIDFIITFINNETGLNQEHIDYTYTIFDESGNELFNQGMHSTYGVEKVKYVFKKEGNFTSQVLISHILFVPVEPDIATFDEKIRVDQLPTT